ncbi:sucrose-phosphate synthase [Desulfosarcina ovata subsp. sediminis]|uniref:sucrose-phosphate synthase n=1 Tax=Desulfosarcina ovata subsp. sediminis TaxID=885957 RepID=A0A5K7ZQ23_9BACT|nr:HAD-IIB family hydrolase [Desulfosarcina ovata]BBO81370.1 sucrose-phosphate synthase [Desulfosarcina ovata subsp. sediminis]
MAADGPSVHLFSLHGLIRATNLEMGRDADTGGQIKYVLELGRCLSERDDIGRVDLFTRLIADKRVSSDYSQPVEKVNDKFRIVRIQCGGRRYMRKELLWPYLEEYVDKTIKFIKRNDAIPDIVHGHYPDAGYVAAQLADILGIPFVYTGHSLGRAKQARLLDQGMSRAEMIKKFKIDRRIDAEEQILARADLVVTSTRHEIDEQYGLYHNKDIPDYQVIPPGIDIDTFYPYYHNILDDTERSENSRYAQASMLKELNRFFMNPDKPLILALSRPDKRKNISGLVGAYGEDLELQSMANLAVFAGLRKDIDAMADNEKEVLTEMLLAMDKYDLYGKMAIPKKHDFEYEVPALYRIAAEKEGVFVNPALTEPFGLTLLEASATGLPIVATNDGGPNDIIQNCRNGILVDVTDTGQITDALRKIIADSAVWDRYSKNGIMNVRKHYTWQSHAGSYTKRIKTLMKGNPKLDFKSPRPSDAIGRRLLKLNHFLITDIDNTLLGDDNSQLEPLIDYLKRYRDRLGFGVATGRTSDSAREILEKFGIPRPDVIICSVGSALFYGRSKKPSPGWASHINNRWNRQKIVDLLKDVDFLEYQEEENQRRYKVSYYMDPDKDRLAAVHDLLLKHRSRYTLIYSHDRYLDILPFRASKGKAIRYLSYRWEIPLINFLVCGDSGNDEEMLRGEPRAVVVGNYSHELESLKGSRNVYFAGAPCSGGIIEGLRHYHFIDEISGG